MKWINVEDRLPDNNEYVLAIYNGGNWLSGGKSEGNHTYRVCQFVKGKTKEENLTGSWTFGDEGFNNQKPYAWLTTGPLRLFGQDVTYWMPLEPPV